MTPVGVSPPPSPASLLLHGHNSCDGQMEVMLEFSNINFLSSRLIHILLAAMTSNAPLGDLIYFPVADKFF